MGESSLQDLLFSVFMAWVNTCITLARGRNHKSLVAGSIQKTTANFEESRLYCTLLAWVFLAELERASRSCNRAQSEHRSVVCSVAMQRGSAEVERANMLEDEVLLRRCVLTWWREAAEGSCQ